MTPSGPENVPDSGTSRHGSNTLQSPIRERVNHCGEQGRAHLPKVGNLKLYLLGFGFKNIFSFVIMSLCYCDVIRNKILEGLVILNLFFLLSCYYCSFEVQ